MDIRALRYFLAVARLQHITKAAAFLHISQPSLSVQIQNLEAELGKPLLKRVKHRISLTAEGELLCKRAEEILSLVDKTAAEIQRADNLISGDIAIASGEIEAMALAMETAGTLRQQYPQIRWHFFSGDASAIGERIEHGLVDFGIFLAPVDVTKYEMLPLPVSMTWGILMRGDSPLAARHVVTDRDMAGLPLITPERLELRQQCVGWLHQDISTLPIAATYNLVHLALPLVRHGFGYALVMDKLINLTHEPDLCFRPIAPAMTAPLCLVWKKYRPLSRQAQVFLDHINMALAEKTQETTNI